MAEDDDCELEINALEKIVQERQLIVYKHEGFWACMDTLRDMDYLNDLLQKDRLRAVLENQNKNK